MIARLGLIALLIAGPAFAADGDALCADKSVAGGYTLKTALLAATCATGGEVYACDADDSPALIAAGTAGKVLTSNGSGFAPSWSGSWMTVTLGPFYLNDVAGSTSNQQLSLSYFNTATALSRATNDVKVQAAAHVIGAFLVSDAARTAGTATLQVRIAGTGAAFNGGSVVLDATNTTSDSDMVLPASGLAVTAGQTVGCEVDTSSWTPTTADFSCWVVVSYD